MPASSDKMLELARALLENDSGEIFLRASVGRSYYALYHEALHVAEQIGLPDNSVTEKGVHDRLISRYRVASKRLRVIAACIHRAKLLRVKADYYLDDQITSKDAQVHLAECVGLVNDLRKIAERNTATTG